MIFVISTACLAGVLIFVLILKQIFFGLRPDEASELPTPPRFIVGKYVLPINGCTYLFKRVGTNFYNCFHPNWKQINLMLMPDEWSCSRELGPVFSVFVWARWRTIIYGETRVKEVLAEGDLVPSWAVFEPKTLLGKSCPCFLETKEKTRMINLIREPLSEVNVLRFATEFARVAESHFDQLLAGNFESTESKNSFIFRPSSLSSHFIQLLGGKVSKCPKRENVSIGSHSLRSFALDLVDGPVLGLRLWKKKDELSTLNQSNEDHQACAKELKDSPLGASLSWDRQSLEVDEKTGNDEVPPNRRLALLWVTRFQTGILGFKFSLGGSWMQVWRLNEYGRALNARQHLVDGIIMRHVSKECNKNSDTVKHRRQSNFIQDPLTTPVPIVTIAKHLDREKLFSRYKEYSSSIKNQGDEFVLRDEHPNEMEDVEIRSEDEYGDTLLDDLFSVCDDKGVGLSNVALAELSMLLWFVLDAGSAWTSMALHLLGLNSKIFDAVRDEVLQYDLENEFNELYSETALSRMCLLNALIYEAIRLSPPFCGGMWQVSKTVSLRGNDRVQVPKKSHVLLANASQEPFDLHKALGKNPFELGKVYPNPKLFGFLPFNGMEVPLMVLQTKVFLIATLKRCEISIPRRELQCVQLDSNPAQEKCMGYEEGASVCNVVRKDHPEVLHKHLYQESMDKTESRYRKIVTPGQQHEILTTDESTMTRIHPTACRQWFSEMPVPKARNSILVRKRKATHTESDTKCR